MRNIKSTFPATHRILACQPSQKVQFQGRVWLFHGKIQKAVWKIKKKNPNNLKVTVVKQVSKNLLPDKFSENRFFFYLA